MVFKPFVDIALPEGKLMFKDYGGAAITNHTAMFFKLKHLPKSSDKMIEEFNKIINNNFIDADCVPEFLIRMMEIAAGLKHSQLTMCFFAQFLKTVAKRTTNNSTLIDDYNVLCEWDYKFIIDNANITLSEIITLSQ